MRDVPCNTPLSIIYWIKEKNKKKKNNPYGMALPLDVGEKCEIIRASQNYTFGELDGWLFMKLWKIVIRDF